ncbi:MAG: hypothetical protein NUV70_08790 [Caldiserica bacterium]|jgi:hypothetical protein|nr:hypothetical protein [Caldisericota bacterium]
MREKLIRKTFLVLAFFLIALSISACSTGSGTIAPTGPDKIEAYVMAQVFVEKWLKAPSTAQYPLASEATIDDLGGGRWRVRAWVDSQNSFGAMVRSNFDCTLKYTGNENWRVEKLILGGEQVFP